MRCWCWLIFFGGVEILIQNPLQVPGMKLRGHGFLQYFVIFLAILNPSLPN